MAYPNISNFGALFTVKRIGGGSATAAGTGDNTEVTGATIDLADYGSGSIIINYTATLAQAKTISFGVKRQQSSDGTNWDTAEVIQALTVADTGGTGGSTQSSCVKIDENFETLKRYVRYNVTPDLNASGTDTCTWAASLVRGGARYLPAT